MQEVPLGRGGPLVSRAGLGLMAMSGVYGPADDAESIATIRAGLDGGRSAGDASEDAVHRIHRIEGSRIADQRTSVKGAAGAEMD